MTSEIIRPITFENEKEMKLFRLPIKFVSEDFLGVDVYAEDIRDAFRRFEENPDKYTPLLPPDDESPSAYRIQDTVILNGEFKLEFDENAKKDIIEVFDICGNDRDFKDEKFFDCKEFLYWFKG